MATTESIPQQMPKPRYTAKYSFPIPVQTTVGRATEERTVEFVPLTSSVPGFTHRVLIDGIARDWLGYGKPSADAAEYFLRKHWTLS